MTLPYLPNGLDHEVPVGLGVLEGDAGVGVAEEDAGSLDAELFPHAGGGVVAELVGVPVGDAVESLTTWAM